MRAEQFGCSAIIFLILVGLYKLNKAIDKGVEINIDNCFMCFRLTVKPKEKKLNSKK